MISAAKKRTAASGQYYQVLQHAQMAAQGGNQTFAALGSEVCFGSNRTYMLLTANGSKNPSKLPSAGAVNVSLHSVRATFVGCAAVGAGEGGDGFGYGTWRSEEGGKWPEGGCIWAVKWCGALYVAVGAQVRGKVAMIGGFWLTRGIGFVNEFLTASGKDAWTIMLGSIENVEIWNGSGFGGEYGFDGCGFSRATDQWWV